MIELYHTHNSVCSQKVRMALFEKKLEWNSNHLLLAKREHQTPEYLKLNPKGVVPTLIDGEEVICESTVIIEYLDDEYPDPPLMPRGGRAKARIRQLMKKIDDDIHMSGTNVVTFAIALRHIFGEQGQEGVKKWIESIPTERYRPLFADLMENGINAQEFAPSLRIFKKMFIDLEDKLEGQDWLVDNTYTLADLSYAPYLARVDRLSLREGIINQYPNVASWYQRLQARPAFVKAIEEFDDPKYVGTLRKKGAELADQVVELYEEL